MGKLIKFPVPEYRFARQLNSIQALLQQMPESALPDAYRLIESARRDLQNYTIQIQHDSETSS